MAPERKWGEALEFQGCSPQPLSLYSAETKIYSLAGGRGVHTGPPPPAQLRLHLHRHRQGRCGRRGTVGAAGTDECRGASQGSEGLGAQGSTRKGGVQSGGLEARVTGVVCAGPPDRDLGRIGRCGALNTGGRRQRPTAQAPEAPPTSLRAPMAHAPIRQAPAGEILFPRSLRALGFPESPGPAVGARPRGGARGLVLPRARSGSLGSQPSPGPGCLSCPTIMAAPRHPHTAPYCSLSDTSPRPHGGQGRSSSLGQRPLWLITLQVLGLCPERRREGLKEARLSRAWCRAWSPARR
ncbi:hypothetical protein P7K49_002184 [Saguinus oedipus]|uniref:Uncharacterized protein n=1 Tax=Saguinus oedipus TaxID=9490 RepID=A0ABQ9WGN9_SAGOE|nr:hypothetical protein P7K49_002184 [Saguinus oedipus]